MATCEFIRTMPIYVYMESLSSLLNKNLLLLFFEWRTDLYSGLTCGNFSNMPEIWISSQPRIRKSVSVSLSKPSCCDGVSCNLLSESKQFSSVNVILPNKRGKVLFWVIFIKYLCFSTAHSLNLFILLLCKHFRTESLLEKWWRDSKNPHNDICCRKFTFSTPGIATKT